MNNTNAKYRLDQATAARLAQLANRPVDVSHLKQTLNQLMRDKTAPESKSTARWIPIRFSWRPTSVAAAILITVMIGWMVIQGGNTPAIAAPVGLAQIYFEVSNKLSPQIKVSSVEEANKVLAAQSSGAMPMPDLPGQMRSCCLHQHKGITLTCVMIQRGDYLITIALADGNKLQSPQGNVINRNGRQLHTNTANGINMVMSMENGRWLCVMGDANMEELITVALGIQM